MTLLIKVALQFIFIFVSIMIGLSSLQSNNNFNNKIILFIGILIFQLIINLVGKYRKECDLRMKVIMMKSINNSLFSILGFSIYLDLVLNNCGIIKSIGSTNIGKAFLISFIITLTIYTIATLENIIMGYPINC